MNNLPNRTPVPEQFAGEPMATDRQITFITDLVKRKQLNAIQLAWVSENMDHLTKKRASTVIERLLKLPNNVIHEAPTLVPEGRYAVATQEGHLAFYRVDKPTEGKWAGRVFVTQMIGPNETPIKNPQMREAILRQIEIAPPAEASKRYGLEIGRCGVCGLRLTNEESREYGIGPICRAKMGW